VADRTEALLRDLETWQGRADFALQQVERIKQELGVIAVRGNLVLLQGGQDDSRN